VNKEFCDDSQIVNNCREVIDAPETTIVRENNQKFGGNFSECINKNDVLATKDTCDYTKGVIVPKSGCISTVCSPLC
jgi:hypothetical protein